MTKHWLHLAYLHAVVKNCWFDLQLEINRFCAAQTERQWGEMNEEERREFYVAGGQSPHSRHKQIPVALRHLPRGIGETYLT